MSNDFSYSTQAVRLEGVPNAREMGGYELPYGKRIKHGLLIRGGILGKASDEAIATLKDKYKLSFLFDFRAEAERRFLPDRQVPGSKYVWLPTIDPFTDKPGETSLPHEAYRCLDTWLIEHAMETPVKKVARSLYPDMVNNEYSQLQYSSFLQLIAKSKSGAVYWHCSQGKDRTGLGAAYLLAALGADRDLIIKDFNLSNEYYEEDVKKAIGLLADKGYGEEEFDVVRAFIGASTVNFIRTLDEIDSTYGSLLDYVKNVLMLSDFEIDNLRSRFLE